MNTGLVVAGVNDGGELDIWGNVTDGTPNIGAYQGKGIYRPGLLPMMGIK